MPTCHAPEFVYIHVDKTGGTFASHALCAAGIAKKEGVFNHHHAISDVKDQLNGRPVLTTIRDPWSWYVSFVLYQYAENGFDTWLYPYTQAVGPEIRDIIHAMVDPVGCGVQSVGLNPPPSRTLEENMSLYSYAILRALWPEGDKDDPSKEPWIDVAIDMHHLTKGLPDAAVALGVPAFRVQTLKILCSRTPKLLSTQWDGDVRKVYSHDLADMVKRKDGWFSDRFGYEYAEFPKRGIHDLRIGEDVLMKNQLEKLGYM